jgi:hypothetical protein
MTNIYLNIYYIILSGAIGYIVGTMKSFREAKHRAYFEILPPILKLAYHPEAADEKAYCEALSKLWLYGSKKVALKMEDALEAIHRGKGNVTELLQKAVVEMRCDIQIATWQKLRPKDVNHLYTRIAGSGSCGSSDVSDM